MPAEKLEMAELVAEIKATGMSPYRHSIVLDRAGQVVEGEKFIEAARLAGMDTVSALVMIA